MKKSASCFENFKMYDDLKHVYLHCKVKRIKVKFNISSPGVLISIPLDQKNQ